MSKELSKKLREIADIIDRIDQEKPSYFEQKHLNEVFAAIDFGRPYTHKVIKDGETLYMGRDFRTAAEYARKRKARVLPCLRIV